MNPWLFAADGLMIITIVALVGVLRGSVMRRLVTLQIVTLFGAVALVLFAFAFQRPDFADLGIGLELLSFGGTLAFAHVVERWL
jgi:multisubunit Na+/H+ antiporter MnhF subunit